MQQNWLNKSSKNLSAYLCKLNSKLNPFYNWFIINCTNVINFIFEYLLTLHTFAQNFL